MNTNKKCSHCGTTQGRIILVKGKEYLCNRHRIQLSRHGTFKHTHIDGNEISDFKNYSVMSIYDVKGQLKRKVKIDQEDVIRIRKFFWFAYGDYVARAIGKKKEMLHHFILGRKKGYLLDHINCNKNDNRKKNLRHVTPSDNTSNRKSLSGLYWDKINKSWMVYIEKRGKRYWLGRHKNKKDAVEKRSQAEIKILGFNSKGTLKALKDL